MDAGNSLRLQVSTNPSIGADTTIAATVASINGFAVSGTVSHTGNGTEAEQNLYYFYPPMAQGFTAVGTVTLSYPANLPTGSRVQFRVSAGNISCSGGNAPPTVSITAPAANSVFTAPATITVSADAQDAEGSVTQVDDRGDPGRTAAAGDGLHRRHRALPGRRAPRRLRSRLRRRAQPGRDARRAARQPSRGDRDAARGW
jgi:hypothetical protein